MKKAIVFDNSGTKLNMSNGINKTIKLNDNILVDNILLFASEGKSVVSFNVNNTSNSIYSKSKLQIKLLDDENSVVYSCQKEVPQILSNSKVTIEEIVEKDISNASSIEIEFVK